VTRLQVALAGAAILTVAGGVYALSRPHPSPPPPRFALNPSPGPSADAGGADLAGRWIVDAGSAGYRVKERFVGQPADTEAVARTATTSGEMVLAASADGLQLQAATFSADISKLKSEDANGTHGSAVRDVFVGRIYLETAVYPMATFVARPGKLASTSSPATLAVPGSFTAHGVTHDLTATLQVSRKGERIEVVGSFPLHYSDYGIDVPQVPFTTANPDATIEVHLFLRRA
jgi:polyisoprenoid-binding protein YceI